MITVTEPRQVYGLYDDSWNGVIVDEAFSHPAKMARGLVRWIVWRGRSENDRTQVVFQKTLRAKRQPTY